MMINEAIARNLLKSRLLKIIYRINRGLANPEMQEKSVYKLKPIKDDLVIIVEQLNNHIHSLQNIKTMNEGVR